MRNFTAQLHWMSVLALAMTFATGCATQQTRVTEVTPRYLREGKGHTVDLAYASGRSQLNGGQVGQSVRSAVGEEFFVRWTSSLVRTVKFEYRQVNHAGKNSEQSATVSRDNWHVFTIGADDFKSGGAVSAWKVSLWDADNNCLAEKQSVMW